MGFRHLTSLFISRSPMALDETADEKELLSSTKATGISVAMWTEFLAMNATIRRERCRLCEQREFSLPSEATAQHWT